jgi:hypothetical protein
MFSVGENEIHALELIEVKMISLKIYMINEYCFDILRFKEQWKHINILILYLLIIILW